MAIDEFISNLKRSKKLQTGYSADLLKNTFVFNNGEQEFVLSFHDSNNCIIVYTNSLQFFSSIELPILKSDEAITVFDVSPISGEIAVGTNKGSIFIYTYISLLNSWELFKKTTHDVNKITCVQWLNKSELLLCDSIKMSVYLIKENEDFLQIWEQKNPGNPIFYVELSNTNYLSCLTFNDDLVYVWKRSLIDLDKEIYDYKLVLLREEGISTMNKWSYLGERTNILYSLNTSRKLNIWTIDGELKKERCIDLSQEDHRFAIIIKNNKKCGRDYDCIITFGKTLDAACMIYKVTWNGDLLHILETKQNLNMGEVFTNGLSNEDFLYFNSLYNESFSKIALVYDMLNQKTSGHFWIDVKKLFSAKTSTVFENIITFGGLVNDTNIIGIEEDPTRFLTQSLNQNLTRWVIKNDKIEKEKDLYLKSNLKSALKVGNSFIYMFEETLNSGDAEVKLRRQNPKKIDNYKDYLFLSYSDQVDVYMLKDLTFIGSKQVEHSEWTIINGKNIIFVSKNGSLTSFVFDADSWLSNGIVDTHCKIEYLDTHVQNNKFLFNTSNSEFLIYDLTEMFIYCRRIIDVDYKSCSWTMLECGEPIFFINLGNFLNICCREETYQIKNDYLLKSISIFSTNIAFQYFGHIEVLNLSCFDVQFKIKPSIEYLLLRLLRDGKYEIAKRVLSGVDQELESSNEFDAQKIFSVVKECDFKRTEVYVDALTWKNIASKLLIKLGGDDNNKNLIVMIQFLQTNFEANNLIINNFNLSAALGPIRLEDTIPLLFEQDNLFGIKDYNLEDINSTYDLFKCFFTIWSSRDKLTGVFEKLSKIEYQETKNPHDVGVFYLSLNKVANYKLLWKFSPLKESVKVTSFLANYTNKRCLNNGYKLLSLHRYKEACWFFLLGNDYKSMFYTTFKRMDSWLLGIGSLRLLDETNEKLKECLQIYCINYFFERKMFWEWFYCGLVIHNNKLDFVQINDFYLELDDLLILLSIFQKFGSAEIEYMIAKRVAIMYQRIGETALFEYYNKTYRSDEAIKIKNTNNKMPKKEVTKSIFDIFNKEDISSSIKPKKPDGGNQEETPFDDSKEKENKQQSSSSLSSTNDAEEKSNLQSSLFDNFKPQSATNNKQPQSKSLLDDWM